jgi:hypothetical protein
MSYEEWTMQVCIVLGEFGTVPERLRGVRWSKLFEANHSPRVAALLAIKQDQERGDRAAREA